MIDRSKDGAAEASPEASESGARRADEPAGASPAGASPATEPAAEAADPDAATEDTGNADVADDPLAAAERDRDEYLTLAQRTQADFENYRKRAAKDMAGAGTRAKASLVRELLPVVDNLERALAAADEAEQALADGVRLVHSDLVAALERSGVKSFEPAGEQFDPTVHEALSTRPTDGAEPGVVLDVVEKGYELDGSVLRPARVVVSA